MGISTSASITAGILLGVGGTLAWQGQNPQLPVQQASQYQQNSAEYRAVCLQTYSWATAMLRTKVRGAKSTMERAHENRPLAIVMDLDETVLDNSGFQSYLDQGSWPYTDSAWASWEHFTDLPLVPGAKGFIESAESQGVTIFYLSNRTVSSKADTLVALAAAGITVKNPALQVLLRPNAGSSNKTERRTKIAATHDILMLVGDNLRDFREEGFVAPKVDGKDIPALRKAIEERKAAVDAEAHRFGSEWIILPNVVYGEFDKLKGTDPSSTLRETDFKG